jgi:DNA replication and repair protein RecF
MNFKENLHLRLHNWRSFERADFALPTESFIIIDDNGSGKTSLISAFYSLFTGQSWPTTKLAQHLQSGKDYFGVSTQYPDWSFTGQISPSGRVVSKYQKLPDEYFTNLVEQSLDSQTHYNQPKILTYLPTDNYWFNQSRSNKLDILDNLLTQILNQNYKFSLQNLDKLVKSKQKLIKHTLENPDNFDVALLSTLNQSILDESRVIWGFRHGFFEYLQQYLPQFEQQINSPLHDWQIKWEYSEFSGQKNTCNVGQGQNILFNVEPNWSALWQKELLVGKVLFGAQRDDFRIVSHHSAVEEVLSRGEMRLLVLFIKNTARNYLQTTSPDQTVFWLLDDVFNEFDLDREQMVMDQILRNTDYFIVTSTIQLLPSMGGYSLNDLTIKISSV